MAESATPSRRRVRRPTRISQQLAAARERNAAQLARQRAQEEQVDGALAAFFDAGEQIAAAQADTQRKIEPHERAIEQLREQLGETVSGAEAAQARAALAIHEADRTVDQVGELLGLGEKAARRLIAAGREAAEQDESEPGESNGGPDDEADGDAHEAGPADDDPGERGPVRPEPAAPAAAGTSWPAGEPGGGQPVRAPAPDDLAVSSTDTVGG